MTSNKQFIFDLLPYNLKSKIIELSSNNVFKERYSGKFQEFLSQLMESEFWSKDKIIDYQLNALTKMVSHCYANVPYYTTLFNKLGLKPTDIRNLDDLHKIPILTKNDVRKNLSSLITKNSSLHQFIKVTTSGTTGVGSVFYHEKSTIKYQWAIWWRFRKRFGLNLLDRHANFAGKYLFPSTCKKPPFWYELPAINQTYFSIYHLDNNSLKYYIDKIQHDNYIYFSGYPSALNIIAEYILSNSISIKNPPKVITTGSESLLPYQKQNIEKAFNCLVTEQYGAAENVCNMSRCEYGNMHHDFELGIIEPITISTFNDITYAKVIATGLVDYAMPLLRYDMGDVMSFSNVLCPCGRKSETALAIDGRTEGIIITPDGRKIGRLAHLFTFLKNVKESRIIQYTLKDVSIEIVPQKEYDPATEEIFRREFQKLVGHSINLKFQYVDSIHKEKNGKLRAVISLVN